jgi:glycolate oxidase FAD binding subunit
LIEHAVGDLVVTVSAGTTLKALQDYLAPYRQFLPLDPAYADEATVGGIVASADAGSWRQRYGGVRDLVLGISFARADGAIAKAGGRVVKNVAGYDLMKLLTGSYGTLGLITQITFRLYPLPESSQTLVVTGDCEAIAEFARVLRASGLSPTAVEWLTSAFSQDLDLGRDASLLLRFQTMDEVATAQRQTAETLARSQSLQTISLHGDREADLWQRWKIRMTDGRTAGEILGKIGVAPQQMASVLQGFCHLSADRGIASLNVGSGLGKLRLPASTSVETLAQLRAIARGTGGFLTLLEAPSATMQAIEPWGFNDSGLDLMKELKQKFDPQHIFSPGRFF